MIAKNGGGMLAAAGVLLEGDRKAFGGYGPYHTGFDESGWVTFSVVESVVIETTDEALNYCRHLRIIEHIPVSQILLESDAPFVGEIKTVVQLKESLEQIYWSIQV